MGFSRRFGQGICHAEIERQERDQQARVMAAENQKRPFEDADVNTIKDRIKELTGKRPRFSEKEQLLNILEFVSTTEETQIGMIYINTLNSLFFSLQAKQTNELQCYEKFQYRRIGACTSIDVSRERK